MFIFTYAFHILINTDNKHIKTETVMLNTYVSKFIIYLMLYIISNNNSNIS